MIKEQKFNCAVDISAWKLDDDPHWFSYVYVIGGSLSWLTKSLRLLFPTYATFSEIFGRHNWPEYDVIPTTAIRKSNLWFNLPNQSYYLFLLHQWQNQKSITEYGYSF